MKITTYAMATKSSVESWQSDTSGGRFAVLALHTFKLHRLIFVWCIANDATVMEKHVRPTVRRDATLHKNGSLEISAYAPTSKATLEAFQPYAQRALRAEGDGQIIITRKHKYNGHGGKMYDQIIFRKK
jgi:hypothetical protein